MNIEKHLLKLIYEFAGKGPPDEPPGSPKDMRSILQNKENSSKQTPEGTMNFEVVQIGVLNPDIMVPLVKFLQKNNIQFQQKNQILELMNIPADPIVIQLALNLPASWIKITAKEDKMSKHKVVKVKGSLARAQTLLLDKDSNPTLHL